ncbi:MAG: adenine methyltransferase [Nitrospinaceae bacterium]|nr:MAG: adenine methyltransferase [Nitrospinaceae bacterium]
MPELNKLNDLVERFDRNREAYLSGQYNETRVRVEFIDPFFKLLGWDVSNKSGHAEAYKDVYHEDAIKIGGATKAPDYSFRIGGTRKFFLEAKKPSVNIKEDVSPAYQLRRYAWSAKLPLSILTDFEEFAVYDCRIKPAQNDKASTARIQYLKYTEYAEKWEEIHAVFSKDAILKGSFDKYAESKKGKRGTAEVDAAFLREMETWRENLARNLALRNSRLGKRDLNFAVQKIMDRIIFLRMCEDRGVENYGQLQGLQNGAGIYPRLCQLFHNADDRYNSGLFHFKEEKGRPTPPDHLTLDLNLDDKILKDILKSLYYPQSPYEFSVLPTEILGQVYEQFLGKVIRLTSGHRAIVEEKPEVKKAGGVYYTPSYIVDYIVKQTVGKLLEGKKPGARSAVHKIKILDPACGSGSFLIGAYQFLLDWHRDRYVEMDPKKHKKALYQGPKGEWRLTTAERKRILLTHIYGVDIDPQAVETTKLSLLLKVLEGERQIDLFRERALPDLGDNIKCGNSLIGPDFYDHQQTDLFDEEERYRINVFDWQAEFPEIMQSGGFDAVIGNPPYVRIQTLKEFAPIEVEFYKDYYHSASKGNYDIYLLFVERGFQLLNAKGLFGFILPHKFFNAKYGEPLRNIISQGNHLQEVVHFGDQQIFSGATTYTCLLFLSRIGKGLTQVIKVHNLVAWRNNSNDIKKETISTKKITAREWNFVVGKAGDLFSKLEKMEIKLNDVTNRIFQGIKTSADKIYIVEEKKWGKNKVKIYSREKDSEYWIETNLLHPLIKGGDSKRYSLKPTNRLILFPYEKKNGGKAQLISETNLKTFYPLTWTYLKDNKRFLENRENGKMVGAGWFGYVYPKALDVMALPKIFTPDIADRASFSFDKTGELFFTGGVSGGYGILVSPQFSNQYILGLLNSKVLEWFIRQSATQMRGGYYSYESRFIKYLPIRTIDFSNAEDKARHDQMVQLVERMLDLHKKLASANTGHDKTVLKRQIDATDQQIDRLVYELYDLTDAEIAIVEESVKK